MPSRDVLDDREAEARAGTVEGVPVGDQARCSSSPSPSTTAGWGERWCSTVTPLGGRDDLEQVDHLREHGVEVDRVRTWGVLALLEPGAGVQVILNASG